MKPLAIPSATPPELRSEIEKARALSSRSGYVHALLGLQSRVKSLVRALPEEIPENDLDRAETLYAYDFFLAPLSAEALNAKRCDLTRRSLRDLADPRGDGVDAPVEGLIVIELVERVCSD